MQPDRDPRTIVLRELQIGLDGFRNGIANPIDIPDQLVADYPQFKVPVVASLDEFIATVNENGINNLVREHTKVNRYMQELPDSTKFVAGAFGWCQRICAEDSDHPFGCHWIRSHDEDAMYYVDGDYGISLGLKLPDERHPLWVGITSFSFGSRLPNSPAINPDAANRLASLIDNLPVILQFQGSHFPKDIYPQKNKLTVDILSRIPWEYVVGKLTVDWWRNMSNEPIFYLPSALNEYVTKGKIKLPRAQQRDLLARELGFTEDPTGLWIQTDKT